MQSDLNVYILLLVPEYSQYSFNDLNLNIVKFRHGDLRIYVIDKWTVVYL